MPEILLIGIQAVKVVDNKLFCCLSLRKLTLIWNQFDSNSKDFSRAKKKRVQSRKS